MSAIHTHSFYFNLGTSIGDSLCLITEFIPNGDPGELLIIQKMQLQANYNSAFFELMGTTIKPNDLRKLANELEKAKIKAESKLKEQEATTNV